MKAISIVALGHVHADALVPLGERFSPIEQLQLDIPPQSQLDEHRAALNRALDAASSDWILILRERESIDAAFSGELDEVVSATPRAWGYRVRVQPVYCGQELRLPVAEGELRLFHRRHLLRREMNVQGTIVRMRHPLRAMSFDSAAAHRDFLGRQGVPHSIVRRLLLFTRNALLFRVADANTLQYLWIEAGYDHSASASR